MRHELYQMKPDGSIEPVISKKDWFAAQILPALLNRDVKEGGAHAVNLAYDYAEMMVQESERRETP